MKENNFLILLLGASFSAYKLAENLLTDSLVPEFRYNIHLNMSNDDEDLSKEFIIYKEDEGKIYRELTANQVVKILNRDDKIPVWIDVSICASNPKFTTIELLCAGRYSSEESDFYYNNRGSWVFGIKSPSLPFDYVNGMKFSVKKVED